MNTPARPAGPAARAGRLLAAKLWLASVICWWALGIPFSRLWWLVNPKQAHAILVCYAWQVPLVGWPGAVLLPWLLWRRVARRASEPDAARRIARYPGQVASLALAISILGAGVRAFVVHRAAALPLLEAAKMVVQGFVIGALFAAAAYLLAEGAIRKAELMRETPAMPFPARSGGVLQSVYSKVLSIAVALTLAVAAPILLYGLGQRQLMAEETLGMQLEDAVAPARSYGSLEAALAPFGPHVYGFVARRSNRFIVAGTGAGRILLSDGQSDFGAVATRSRGHFAGRDREHKVVAFNDVPSLLPDGDDAIFVAVSPMSDWREAALRSTGTAAALGGAVLIVGLVLSAMLARSIVDPLRQLHAATDRMAAGELEVGALAMAGGDEVAALARAFDAMARRVRADESDLRRAYSELAATQDRLVQTEKLAAAGRVISGVAHELNNPLAAVLNLTDELLGVETRPAAEREALEVVSVQARRARSIVRELLAFVRRREDRGAPTDVALVLERAVDGLRHEMDRTGVRVAVTIGPNLPRVYVDPVGFEQILGNLITNGAQAAGRGGAVSIVARAERNGCAVVVEDDGPGIAPDVMPHIFEPFYTTKATGQGTGLGLSVSLGIATQYHGKLEVRNRPAPERGARATLWLRAAAAETTPAAERRTVARATPADAAPTATALPALTASTVSSNGSRDATVLLVEDEPSIRFALRRYFERRGWHVDEADDGEAGLARLLGKPAQSYDVIITDLRMPGISGTEFHDRLSAERPDLFTRLVVMSGDVASPEAAALLARTDRPVIEKPFELAELEQVIRDVLG
ncbi:MAG TPA: ATP-binding protein [Gemmatimonadales bacterium]|nr:ATP-binding protein [Gemmatimonadales bacterium]